jgi:hypothetical protein
LIPLESFSIKVKIALASRRLFTNWYQLLINYLLTRIGLNVRLKAKTDKHFIELNPKAYARLLILTSCGLIKSVKYKDDRLFINGIEIEINNFNEIVYKLETWVKLAGWRYDTSCNCWVKNVYVALSSTFSSLKNIGS